MKGVEPVPESAGGSAEKKNLANGEHFPANFKATFQDYLAGEATLSDVRREVSNSLYKSLDTANVILEFLKAEQSSGRLSDTDHIVLVGEVNQITSEETPTDVSVKLKKARLTKKSAPVLVAHEVGVPKKIRHADTRGHGLHFPVDIRPGAVLRNRFELEDRIAGGSMGELYRATDRMKLDAGAADATVAIKVVNRKLREWPEALRALQQEASKAQHLSHPNIVNVFDLDRADGEYFLTMEWLNGESLANRLDRTRPHAMSWQDFRFLFSGMVAGLEYAHEQGVVHGDIKPGNIFLTEKGQVKLLDFGLATVVDGEDARRLDAPINLTRAYASCEVHEGQRPTVQDDVYALAFMVYRMVAGHRPFGGRDALEAERDRLKPKRPKGLSDRQWKALLKGLAFRRIDRPTSVRDFANSLLQGSEKTKRHGWMSATVAVGLLGVMGLIGLNYVPETLRPMFSDFDGQGIRMKLGLQSPEARAPVAEPVVPVEVENDRPTLVSPVPIQNAPATTEFENSTTPAAEGDGSQAPGENELARPMDGDPVAEDIMPQATLTRVAEEPLLQDAVPAAEPVTAVDAEVIGSGPIQQSNSLPELPGFVTTEYRVREGDGFVRLDVQYPPDIPERASLRVSVVDGSAFAGEDFIRPFTTVLQVTPGQTSEKILVPLISDSQPEFTEDFIVRLESQDGELVVAPSEAIVIIIDDDRSP